MHCIWSHHVQLMSFSNEARKEKFSTTIENCEIRHSKNLIFLRSHNFSCTNFEQENGQKKAKNAPKVGKNGQKA